MEKYCYSGKIIQIQSDKYNEFNECAQCYICLEPIEYYIKFDCECYNFCHVQCITESKPTKCSICRGNINFNFHKKATLEYLNQINQPNQPNQLNDMENLVENIYSDILCDITFLTKIIAFAQINNCANSILRLLMKYKNFGSWLMFVITCILFTFGIIIPLYCVNIFLNIIKYARKKTSNFI